jgi:hypothetical protein
MLKTVRALAVVFTVIGAQAALVTQAAQADEKPKKEAPPDPGQAQNSEKLNALLKERRDLAKSEFESCRKALLGQSDGPAKPAKVLSLAELRKWLEEGPDVYDARVSEAQRHLYEWAQRILTAELESSDKKADRLAAYEAHLSRMKAVEDELKKEYESRIKSWEDLSKKRYEGGKDNVYTTEARYHRLEAEIMLEREKAK